MAPVAAPLHIEFQGSSFFRTYTNEQSMAENNPPHTAKFPAKRNMLIIVLNKVKDAATIIICSRFVWTGKIPNTHVMCKFYINILPV